MLKLHQPLAITHQLAQTQMLKLASECSALSDGRSGKINRFSKRSSVNVSDARDSPTSAKVPKHVVRGKKSTIIPIYSCLFFFFLGINVENSHIYTRRFLLDCLCTNKIKRNKKHLGRRFSESEVGVTGSEDSHWVEKPFMVVTPTSRSESRTDSLWRWHNSWDTSATGQTALNKESRAWFLTSAEC